MIFVSVDKTYDCTCHSREGSLMKRDMELVKKILLFYEELKWPVSGKDINVAIDGFDSDTIQFHLELLVEAELLYF